MSDAIYIGGAARRLIEKQTRQDLSGWSGPNVTSGDRGDYKVEWRPPDADDAVLTIYKDGGWDLYVLNGQSFSGKMMVLHNRRWIRTRIKDGVIPDLARSYWMYFKDLSLGKLLS